MPTVCSQIALPDATIEIVDFGGSGRSALLIHGLCGTALEWASTAEWLTKGCRVVAYDQRGHGKSTRRPGDVSNRALVDDAAAIVGQLKLAPAVVIGQSLGGRIAFLLASRHSELVKALVVVDASPDRNPEVKASLQKSLSAWPVPFESRKAAAEYFGGEPFTAQAWAESLEERDGWFWPQFDLDVMIDMMRDAAEKDCWEEWRRIIQPTLVVGGDESRPGSKTLQKMADEIPNAEYVAIPGAGHDVHLDRPDAWHAAVLQFVAQFEE